MIPDQYVWPVWASAFLVPWLVLFASFPRHRTVMWWASVFTAPFGLTEPLFVPEYWNPPSLFDLAQTTGFDVESLIFCFAIGGVGAVLYNVLTRRVEQPVPEMAKRQPLHRHHYKALASPFLVFLLALQLTAPGYIERVWNFKALTGVRLFGMPLEELLFAFGFGMYWSSVYEHFTWNRPARLVTATSREEISAHMPAKAEH